MHGSQSLPSAYDNRVERSGGKPDGSVPVGVIPHSYPVPMHIATRTSYCLQPHLFIWKVTRVCLCAWIVWVSVSGTRDRKTAAPGA